MMETREGRRLVIESRPHPEPDRLAAFARGELGDAELTSVQAHLEECPACCDRLAAIDAPDDFASGLRDAARHIETLTLHGRIPAAVYPRFGEITIPGYELLRELGRGGMGVVYDARHIALNRTVAIKLLRDASLATPAELSRFRSEALALARLHHPNIVQVFETGTHQGIPFVVLEYLAGGTLAQSIHGKPQRPREAAALVAALAAGVQAAHDAGIIHRDLKPANVLLTAPPAIPKISDFGLAKLLDGAVSHTASGAISGTPNYMAPEQAAGNSTAGPATDVYALGAILYELLAGRPPFAAATLMETLEQVRSREPVPPGRLQEVPRDLETICLKCLHKEPAARYATAAALRDDLQRFLEGRPILARRISLPARAVKWVRRSPLYATLLAALAIAILTGIVGVMLQFFKTEKARRDAVAESRRAQNLAAEMALDQGILQCEQGQVDRGLEALQRALALCDGKDDTLDFAIRANIAAWQNHDTTASRIPLQNGPVTGVAFSPDGQSILTGDSQGRAELWDIANLTKPRIAVEHPGPISCVAFAPDGSAFVTGSTDSTVRFWDARMGQAIGLPLNERLGGSVRCMAFNPRGDRLAIGYAFYDSKTHRPNFAGVAIWSWPERRQIGDFFNTPTIIQSLAWHPQQNQLAVGGLGDFAPGRSLTGSAKILDLDNERFTGTILFHPEPVWAVLYHPDGTLATACEDGAVRFWKPDGQRTDTILRHAMPVNSLAFTKGGRVLIAGCGQVNPGNAREGPGEIQVWDVATREKIGPPLGEKRGNACNRVNAVAASPDGSRLAAASENGLAWVGPLPAWDEPVAIARFSRPATPLFSPDGKVLLAFVKAEGDARKSPAEFHLLNAANLKPLAVIEVPHDVVPRFSPDSQRLLAYERAGQRRLLQMWSVPSGMALEIPAAMRENVLSADRSESGNPHPFGQFLAAASGAATDKARLSSANGKLIGPPIPHPGRVDAVAFSPDGRTFATSGSDKSIRLWKLPESR